MLSEDGEGRRKAVALPTMAAPSMRFSRRQRGMDTDQDLAADQEVEMQEAHLQQHRWACSRPCQCYDAATSSVLLRSAQG